MNLLLLHAKMLNSALSTEMVFDYCKIQNQALKTEDFFKGIYRQSPEAECQRLSTLDCRFLFLLVSGGMIMVMAEW